MKISALKLVHNEDWNQFQHIFFSTESPFNTYLLLLLLFFIVDSWRSLYSTRLLLVDFWSEVLTSIANTKVVERQPQKTVFVQHTNWFLLLETDLRRRVLEKFIEFIVGTVTDPTPPGTVVVCPHLEQ